LNTQGTHSNISDGASFIGSGGACEEVADKRYGDFNMMPNQN